MHPTLSIIMLSRRMISPQGIESVILTNTSVESKEGSLIRKERRVLRICTLGKFICGPCHRAY